jgi:hypothetical protein
MSGMPGSTRSLAAIAWALLGLFVGHFLAYLAVYPDAHTHADALSRSGHGWLWIAGPAVAVAAALAVLGGLVGGRRGHTDGVPFRTLALVQITAFVSLELGERIAGGADAPALLHDLFGHALWVVLLVGIVVQLLIARIGSTASRLLAEAAASPVPRRPVPRIVTVWLGFVDRPLPSRQRIQPPGRAPPVIVSRSI